MMANVSWDWRVLALKAKEDPLIGKTDHDWERPPAPGNIWQCRTCGACTTYNGDNLLAEPHYEIPQGPGWSSYLGSHDRECPCLCVICSGEYKKIRMSITVRHRANMKPNTPYIDHILAINEEVEAWMRARPPR